jgi:hypothetical protein
MNTVALSEYFEATAQQRAEFGHLDCVRFVVDAMYVGWNRDYRDVLKYYDRRSAVNRLRAAGGLFEAFKDELGEPVPASELRPGDIAWYSDPAVGLVLEDCIVVKIRKTIIRMPLDSITIGWKL